MKAHIKLFFKAIINVLVQLQKNNQTGKQINQAEMLTCKQYWQIQNLAQNDKHTNRT